MLSAKETYNQLKDNTNNKIHTARWTFYVALFGVIVFGLIITGECFFAIYGNYCKCESDKTLNSLTLKACEEPLTKNQKVAFSHTCEVTRTKALFAHSHSCWYTAVADTRTMIYDKVYSWISKSCTALSVFSVGGFVLQKLIQAYYL